jgi:protein tyrosine/serine phosphatase
VIEFLRLLAGPDTGRVYLHCEAGKGRTGVMTACYRMAVMGWSPKDAQLEARNFGCSIPDQVNFIQGFGEKLAQGDPGLVGYPRQPLGSHRMTAPERDVTIAKVAAGG